MDASLDPVPARLDGLRGAHGLHAHALGSHGDDDVLPDGGMGGGIRHQPGEAEPSLCGHDGSSGHRVMLRELPVNGIGDADEVGDEAVHRALVELRRCSLLLDAAMVHDDDDVAHGQGLLLVVRHVDERDANLLLQRLELQLHLLAELEIQGAQRLVQEQHRGVIDQGAGQGHTLLLAAGELPGAPALVPAQAHELQGLANPAGLIRLGRLPLAQAVAHVPGNVHVREERVVLEDRVDVAPVRRDAGHRLAGEVDLAAGGLLEARDHPQGGGLAAAGRPKERVEGAALHGQVHLVHRDHVAEPLRHAGDAHVRLLAPAVGAGDGGGGLSVRLGGQAAVLGLRGTGSGPAVA